MIQINNRPLNDIDKNNIHEYVISYFVKRSTLIAGCTCTYEVKIV